MQYQGPKLFENLPLVRTGKYMVFFPSLCDYYILKSVNTEFKFQKLKMIFLFFTGHNEENDRGQREKLQIVGVCLKKFLKHT